MGARTEPRLREYFDRLVDRVSAYEVKALAEGDGFTEKKYENASIDDLMMLVISSERMAIDQSPTGRPRRAGSAAARGDPGRSRR